MAHSPRRRRPPTCGEGLTVGPGRPPPPQPGEVHPKSRAKANAGAPAATPLAAQLENLIRADSPVPPEAAARALGVIRKKAREFDAIAKNAAHFKRVGLQPYLTSQVPAGRMIVGAPSPPARRDPGLTHAMPGQPDFRGPVISRRDAVKLLREATGIAHGDTLRDRARGAPAADPLSVLAKGGSGRPAGRRGYYRLAVEWVGECYSRTPGVARAAADAIAKKAQEGLLRADNGEFATHAKAQVIGAPRRRRQPKE